MSGIAGILRRDGGPVPQKWINLLEQSLMLGGKIPFHFEDSIPVENGNLHIHLLSGDGNVMDSIAIDGDIEGECAFGRWKEKTLELELGRNGTGQKSLYWFDLAQAGDGLLFCTNPLPLLQIAHELELPKGNLAQGIQEYLQYGFVVEGGEMLSPVCSLPIKNIEQGSSPMTSAFDCKFSTTIAEDVQILVRILGTPFADYDLLSTLQQYRYAKNTGCAVVDGLVMPQSTRFFERLLPLKQDKKQYLKQRQAARRIELGAIASYVGVDLLISPERDRIDPIPFPLSSWLRSMQSSLGELAGDTFNSSEAFSGLPIDKKQSMQMLDAHRNGDKDKSRELFALLTLELWRQLVHA
jgi:hypothetical protein